MGIFDGILGNELALRLLESALASGEVAHAYLFYGPPGVGKRTVARRFGAALVSGGDGVSTRTSQRSNPKDGTRLLGRFVRWCAWGRADRSKGRDRRSFCERIP